MTTEMTKMMKTAKLVDRIFKALYWMIFGCGIVAALICFAAGVFLFVDDPMVREYGFSGLSIMTNGLSVDLGNLIFPREMLRSALFFAGGVFAVASFLAGWMLRIVRGILEPMKQGRPFEESVSKSLRKLGFLVLVFGVVGMFMQYLLNVMINYCLADTLIKAGITVRTGLNFELIYVLIACILFLFSYIFKYGEQLQTQVDETL